ncbi:MAG: hypothetical protein K8F91_04250, partial [Candidatus Obscuribacterales bacterium]|nr:hypothetical protein [Candidatus Obscuribacterales bacterium]
INVCLGYANFRLGNFEKALEHFNTASTMAPSSQSAYLGMAEVYFLAGDLKNTRKYASRSQSSAKHPVSVLLIANIDQLEGKEKEALAGLRSWKTILKNGKHRRSMTEIGFSKQHDFKWDAFNHNACDNDWLLKARYLMDDEDGKKRQAFAERGKVFAIMNSLESRLNVNPEDFFLLHELALARMASNENEKAISTFKKVLEACDQCHIDLLNLAICYDRSGKADLASKYLIDYKKIYQRPELSTALEELAKEPEVFKKPVASPATAARKPIELKAEPVDRQVVRDSF